MLRRVFLLFLWLVSSTFSVAAEASKFVERTLAVQGRGYCYRIFVPDGWTAKKPWPVVLFLHGSGEAGSDNTERMAQGLPPWLRQHGTTFLAVVVIPQASEQACWNGNSALMPLQAMQNCITEFHGDRQRLYITSLSMGGFGTWQIAIDHPTCSPRQRLSVARSTRFPTSTRCTPRAFPLASIPMRR